MFFFTKIVKFSAEFVMAPMPSSVVWKYFSKNDEKSAKCNQCQKTIKTAGNTTNLMGHIKNIHKAIFLEINKNSSEKQQQIDPNNVTKLRKNTKVLPEPCQPTSSSCNTNNETDSCIVVSEGTVGEVVPFKRQKSIQSSFEDIASYSSGEKAKKINNAIVYMICKDNHAFSLVENEGFKHLIKVLSPHFKVPSRHTVTRWVDNKYDDLSKILKNQLPSVENITLTSDIWSDLQMRSFLGITAHFGIGTEFHSITLGVYPLDERHTSEYISTVFEGICNEWDFSKEKVTAVVTDNAANMTKAVELTFGKKKHVSCFAHTLNLVAQKVLSVPELQALLKRIKNIVTFFKQSCVASDELRKSTKGETKLIQDVPTRWNSTFYMIQRFLELQIVVSEILLRHKTAPPMLTGMELTLASKLLNILRPLEAATKEICGDTYCNSSKVIPLVHCMVSKLKALVFEETLLKEVQTIALAEVNKRMGAIEQDPLLSIATLMDPRFKKLHFVDPLSYTKAIAKIQEIIENEIPDDNNIDSDSDTSDKIADNFSLWSDHHKLAQRDRKANRNEESLSDELSIYLRSPVSQFNENPLEVWAGYKMQFPKLYKIAYKHLTMVASSVPSERLFSKASFVLTQQRSRLQAKRVNKILFLQSLNKKYWDI